MHLFFDFTVWPRNLGQLLSIRIYICCVDPYTPFFVFILTWPRSKTVYKASHIKIVNPLKTATFRSRRPFRIYTQQEIYFFRGLSDFGHFSVAMAKNEIIRIGPLILIILHHHFASKQFGHGHLGQL